MVRHRLTAVVALAIFVAMLLTVLLTPVAFVAWSPGQTVDLLSDGASEEVVTVEDWTTHPSTGRLMLTTVSQTRANDRLRFPQAILNHLLPTHEVRPYDEVYRSGVTADALAQNEQDLMAVAQTHAIVAALRQLQAEERGRPVAGSPISVSAFPVVSSVRASGPANEKLQVGDILLTINQVPVMTVAEATNAVLSHSVGVKLTIEFIRPEQGQRLQEEITLGSRANDFESPTMGVSLEQGYAYSPAVEFHIDAAIGGNSAGLALALAVYDRLTTGDLMGGQSVAAAGVINLVEPVGYPIAYLGRIEAIKQKLAAAERAGAELYLFPQANCPDLSGVETSVRLIPVNSFASAVEVLTDLETKGDQARVPRC